MIRFTADHHSHIGQSHLNQGKPRQDYALSGVLDGAAFALVADGCSSGGHTETGASILVHAGARAIRRPGAYWPHCHGEAGSLPAEEQGIIADQVRGTLGLKQSDMLATSAMAFFSVYAGFVHLIGDGVIAYKKRGEDIIEMHRFDWEGNMPFYPVYAQNPKAFIDAQGGDLDGVRMVHQAVWYDGSEHQRSAQHTQITLREGMRGITHHFSAEEVAELEYVAVFTDGVTQFKNTAWTDIVHDLLAIKSTAGEFMKRRLGRVVKDTQKSGDTPMDDVGVAIIRVEQISETGDVPC